MSHCPNSRQSSVIASGLKYKSQAQQSPCPSPSCVKGRPLDLLHIPPSWAVSLPSLGIHSRFKVRRFNCYLLSKVWGVESTEHTLRVMVPISFPGRDRKQPRLPLRLPAELADEPSPWIQDQSVQAPGADGRLSRHPRRGIICLQDHCLQGGTWDTGLELEMCSRYSPWGSTLGEGEIGLPHCPQSPRPVPWELWLSWVKA